MNDTNWINEISPDIARSALDLLDDIVEKMDLLQDPVVISPYVANMGIGQENSVREWKMTTLGMLKKRGVLRDAEYRHERGGRPGIWIDADEKIVRTTHGLLRDRVHKRQSAPVSARSDPAGPGRVFLVCGRDDGANQTVARFLEGLGVKLVILAEQSHRGLTMIEKLEYHSDSDYAVVLLTPDDEGRLVAEGEALAPRARENVVGELFYFTAKLGRDHVCALIKGKVKLPSDYDGFGHTPMEGDWRLKLAQELRDAGVQADYSKVIR